jgi:glutaminyl-tRNA synthetase
VSSERPSNFIRDIVDEDLASGRHTRVVTRFPPEPNGYPHIGHAKAICLNFGLARDYGGVCHLRMDDTNPETEDMEYVRAFQRDIRWLGFDWGDKLFFASDYFGAMHDHAVSLIERGLAYVDSASEDEIRAARGSLSEAGRPTAGRARSVAENLDLFRRMRAGEFPDGAHVLRARVDLAAANMKMRDPLLYRIRHARHYRTGDTWCIYPMYDYAHPLSDALEGITHSICTLEFENNRDIYDWVVEHCPVTIDGRRVQPRQYEMARLAVGYTVMSKRKLLKLVGDGLVDGWDDPRMPTISGMRRRGLPPEALRAFVEGVGVAKNNSMVDVGKLEFAVRDQLNTHAPRAMCVLRPLRLVITDFAGGAATDAPWFPGDPSKGGRPIAPAREVLIEQTDFVDGPPPAGWKRLVVGGKVRLRHGPVVLCREAVKDASGAVVELRCTTEASGKDVGVIHWVPAEGSVPVTARLYDRLFRVERPDELDDFKAGLNPASLEVVEDARLEPSLAAAAPGERFQFERLGYFTIDETSRRGALVVNRIVELRDTYDAKPHEAAPPAAATKPKSSKAQTRPKQLSPVEARKIARERDPAIAARYQRFLGLALSEDNADLLSAEPALAEALESALRAGWRPKDAARVCLNQLQHLYKLDPACVATFRDDVWKTLLPAPTERLKAFFAQLGHGHGLAAATAELTPAEASGPDLGAVIDAVLGRLGGEVARYRAGEQKLFGFLVGQVMKQAGKADPAAVQAMLRAKLG